MNNCGLGLNTRSRKDGQKGLSTFELISLQLYGEDFLRKELETSRFMGKNSLKRSFHRRFSGKTTHLTITKEPDGGYPAAILVNGLFLSSPKKPALDDRTPGIDTVTEVLSVLSSKKAVGPSAFSKNGRNHPTALQSPLIRKAKDRLNRLKTELKSARPSSKAFHLIKPLRQPVSNQ